MYRFHPFGKNAIGATPFVLLTVISLRAYGMGILTPTEQQIADAGELKAASWLICHQDLQSPVSGHWRWNPELKEFEKGTLEGEKGTPEGEQPIILIFDQNRHRALEATVESTSSPQTNATPSATVEADLRIKGELSVKTVADPFLSILVEATSDETTSSGELMITQARAKDGGFVAVVHYAGFLFFPSRSSCKLQRAARQPQMTC